MRMAGDEMVPLICDGDLLFVDRAADRFAGNGIYALEVDKRLMVRRVESRLGAGLVVKCENEGYQESVVKDAAAAKRAGLRVIGKVRGAVGVARFWND
jgi:phage repressor protein C with HTH and peptisase S24 domain